MGKHHTEECEEIQVECDFKSIGCDYTKVSIKTTKQNQYHIHGILAFLIINEFQPGPVLVSSSWVI